MSDFWHLKLTDLVEIAILAVTCWAIWYGPQKAIHISRDDEDRREARRRKYHIFHELMRTRSLQLDPQHVAALNLIQLEFYGHDTIQEAYKRYIENLNSAMPTAQEEQDRFIERRRDLLFDLLHGIGAALGMTYDKRELERLSYSPVGWANDINAQRTLRDYVIQVITGQRAFHVAPFGGPDPRFPPTPQQPKIEDKG